MLEGGQRGFAIQEGPQGLESAEMERLTGSASLLRPHVLRTAGRAVLFLALAVAARDASACDGQTEGWVNGVSNYWHGTLGKFEFCNNASIGANRQKAADCAWNFTVARFGAAPDPVCARQRIETSPQGKADLDAFFNTWQVASGGDCAQSSIDAFFPHWHGALGRPEYCNNAAIGPDRQKAKECAFQALVHDKGVLPNSCLRDAIANSAAGTKDLDDFVQRWRVASGADCSQASIDHFFAYWHGALGKPEVCNNASIGPDREKAKACAFQALRDLGVAANSCLRDAIANSVAGKKDLDDFVETWRVASGADCSPSSIKLFANYWHGALGKAEYCNNASIGPDREKAKECAFQALVRDKGVSPTSCLREAIANSPEGKADLDTFVLKWQEATGAVCTPESIKTFSPHWHGALGKAEYCNNAAIGPDREAAKECAFQALVREMGVAPDSCLREAIANSTAGSEDLDAFVRLWTAVHSSAPAGTVAANMRSVTPADAESCDPAKALEDNYLPPRDMLDWTPTVPAQFTMKGVGFTLPGNLVFDATKQFTNSLGANEGRLRAELRAAAKAADPLASLCQSAKAFARKETALGNALADLSVTGRKSFAQFRTARPDQARILPCAHDAQGVARALARAYKVANAIRFGYSPERRRLGWIAVSGEDDQPHRPVNVPSAEFAQHDLAVTVPVRAYNGLAPAAAITVNTRYMIAYPPPAGLTPRPPLSDRVLPADPAPVLPADAEVILFVHGMDSRLEEALDLTHALHRIAAQTGRKYTVVSMDLPTSGYADNIDHLRIAPLETTGMAKFRPLGAANIEITDLQIFDAGVRNNAPIVDFDEDFIVAFVNTLDGKLAGLKRRIRAIVGGSLGGNMAMRLGRRPDLSWIKTVVPWSPAAIWPSFVEGANLLNHFVVAVPWLWAGGDARIVPEIDVMRRLFFYYSFDWRMGVAQGKPQAEEWYRDGWTCKAVHMFGARLDRHETYDSKFRLWHWRLGAEQLLFSQQLKAFDTQQPLYMQNTTRMLLACGYDDTGGNLCAHTRDVAGKMTNTPGKALFLLNTGHSIQNERPNWLARNITDFLEGR